MITRINEIRREAGIKGKALALIVIIIMVMSTFAACGEKSGTDSAGECTISFVCHTAAEQKKAGKVKENVASVIPDDGIILEEKTVVFQEGDTAVDVTRKAAKEDGIQLSVKGSGDTGYIEGISNLYEFDCGGESGWMFSANGEFPEVSPGQYKVKDKDKIIWEYTCNGGKDIE